MDEDEEMKTQCFGGDYMGEVNFINNFLLTLIMYPLLFYIQGF